MPIWACLNVTFGDILTGDFLITKALSVQCEERNVGNERYSTLAETQKWHTVSRCILFDFWSDGARYMQLSAATVQLGTAIAVEACDTIPRSSTGPLMLYLLH